MNHEENEDRAVYLITSLLVDKIGELEQEVLTLMRAGATVKATGPVHTAEYLRSFVRELHGPHWQEWLNQQARKWDTDQAMATPAPEPPKSSVIEQLGAAWLDVLGVIGQHCHPAHYDKQKKTLTVQCEYEVTSYDETGPKTIAVRYDPYRWGFQVKAQDEQIIKILNKELGHEAIEHLKIQPDPDKNDQI